jgi:DNA-binding LacI/PurR family transcriptional regulator
MAEINMREVARAAGVSIATVSRTFQTPNQVRSETREKVRKAVHKLGYIYNAAAADFTGKRSTVLGILTPKIGSSLFGDSLTAIHNTAAEKGFSVMVGCTDYDYESERRLLNHFQERRLCAIILIGYAMQNTEIINNLIESGRPCVVMWEKLESRQISYVGIDNRKAAYSATSHLLNLGHRRIGLIAGPYSLVRRVRNRWQGYRDALAEYNVPYEPELVFERTPSLVEGKVAAEQLLSQENPPTAIFAASDTLAIGAMQAIHERGYKMPRDISLVGFDDIEVASYLNPSLSSVRVDGFQIGKLAAEIAIETASNPSKTPRQYCLDTDLIVRNSSGPCSSR